MTLSHFEARVSAATCIGADWQPIATAPLGVEVDTKIDDDDGVRNIQTLIARQRAPECRVMWFVPDGSMYVYYTPTHWRSIA